MKRTGKRLLSLLLAAQMLSSSAGLALAADTASPYGEVIYSVGYDAYAGEAWERRLRVEGDTEPPLSTYWNNSPYTLASLPDFPLAPSGRVPDRTFADWTVYTGLEGATDMSSNEFEDLGKSEILDPSKEIYRGDFDNVVNQDRDNAGNTWKGLNKLPLVGRWKLSDEAYLLPKAALASGESPAATGFSTAAAEDSGCNVLYGEDISRMSVEELKKAQTVDFSTDQREYWLRVTTETERLDLTVIAPEPYIFDGITEAEKEKLGALPDEKKPGVHVTVTTVDKEVKPLTATQTVLNDSVWDDPQWTQKCNSGEYPARSQWKVSGIELEQSAGEGRYYNDVTVTVVSPSGEEETTYVFHIQRLGEPVLTRSPGNTPFGMLARDSGLADKAAAQADFAGGGRSFSELYRPKGDENNNGAVYSGGYGTNAWAGKADFDPDLDETAVVVYQNSGFTLPGFSITDSAGNAVAGDSYESTMRYKLALRLVEPLTWKNSIEESGAQNYYSGTGMTTDVATPAVTQTDGSIEVNLQGACVAPGIYKLEYYFEDPISGKPYSSAPESFFTPNRANAEGFSRTLIVLPLPGDVDMNGAVTMADALTMETMLAADGGFQQALAEKNPTACLIAYRVCDIDGDGDFTQADAYQIWNGYKPNVKASVSTSNYFYLPLLGRAGATRSEPPAPTGGKPQLTLDYLGPTPVGLEEEALDEALQKGEVLAKTADYGEGLRLGDVFWVGIRLTLPQGYTPAEANALRMGISAAALSIAYDSTLVAPAELEGLSWEDTLRRYNARLDEKGVSTRYMWSRDYDMVPGSNQEEAYAPRFDPTSGGKAIMPLEAAAGDNIRELRVAIRQEGEVRRVLYDAGNDIVLLRVPFRVIAHPHNQKEMRALDLSLGPRELALAGFFAADQPLRDAIWNNPGGAVFGGATGNLADQLEYGGGTALTIKLGEDKTEYQDLTNLVNGGKTVYGEEFSAQTNTSGMTEEEKENLPKGLEYIATGADAGYIQGIPAQTGTFTFYVGGHPYRLTVDKAVLDLTVTAQRAYYGEALPTLTFTYDPAQIKALDKSGGANDTGAFGCTGAGSELSGLGGCVSAPVIRAVTALSGGSIAAAGTPVGEYYVVLTGGENENYQYRYGKNGYGGEADFDGGYGRLEILPRPIVVEKLLKDKDNPLTTILYDAVVTEFQMTSSNKSGDFAVRRGGKTGENVYNGLPLTDFGVYGDDELVIAYQADYIKDASRGDGATFALKAEIEPRDMKITSLVLKQDEGAGANYVLVDPKLDMPVAAEAGLVVDRPATKLEIIKGVGLDYGNGAGLNLANMTIRITYGREPDTREVMLSYESRESFLGSGVQVTWEDTPSGDAPTPDHSVMEDEDHNLFLLSASEHSGKYLCVWVPTSTVEGSGQSYIRAAMKDPLHVAKTMLTLSLDRMGRYYGEENPEVTFTYDPSKLSAEDYNAIKEGLKADPKGDGSELVHLAGYQKPDIVVQKGLQSKELVGPGTPARRGLYLSIISGGGSANIDFDFARVGKGANSDFGYDYFDIYPRPIVIDQVTMANGDTDSDYFLYDNTELVQLVTMTYGEEKRKPAATAAGTEKNGVLVDRFTASLPAGNSYFPAGGGDEIALRKGYALTGDAVLQDNKLSLTYQANFRADAGKTDAPYFELTKGTERRTVDIRKMALAGDQKDNYLLVYETNTEAIEGMPRKQTAEGTVKMRAMEKIEISLGGNFRTSYTYGSQLSLDKMSLKVTFETAGDNAPDRNQAVQSVSFRPLVVGGAIVGDTFSSLGLSVGWAPGEGEADGGEALLKWLEDPKWSAANGSYPTAVDHSGRQLIVYGRRYEGTESDLGHPVIFAETSIADGIVIAKKVLPLNVTAQNRYYGEPNPLYEFTFRNEDLAEPDRKKLAGRELTGSATATDTAASSAALAELCGQGGYTGPVFKTDAKPGTDVGIYDLSLSGGEMDNYTFSHTAAAIRIFRRPIVIDKITKDPVYTIYYNNIKTEFTTNAGAKDFTAKLPALVNGNYRNGDDPEFLAAMGNTALPLTGNAVLSTDRDNGKLSLNFSAIFPASDNRVPIPDGQKEVSQSITIAKLSLAAGTGNYILVYNNKEDKDIGRPMDHTAAGKLDKRNIESIRVVTVPKMVYTYGEGLDLSNLQIEITYEHGEGETPPVEIVRADSRDGVYVNYYNSGEIPAKSEDWAKVTTTYRTADNGDHLTIAPDHDTTFANFGQADGKYLIISAVVDPTLGFVRPVVVPASVDGNGNPVGKYQIQVNPLELSYTLKASDKTYDGERNAVGELAFTNAYNRDGTTDVVYAVTGADYEKNSKNYLDYTGFLSRVAEKGYLFSTGEYDSDTGTLTYTGGAYGDGENKLTYAFVVPNVNYQDDRDNAPKTPKDAGWDSYGALAARVVEVTGIRLGGADADNYKIDKSVLEGTAPAPGRPAAPKATIHKASRAAPLPAPKLEVDIHTNAVKVSMEKSADAYQPRFADDFAGELHFEYRLESWEATDVVTPVAAAQTPENGAYQDEAFFGGEPMEIPLPDGYEPSREPEPPREGDPVKGQIYRWAEEDALFGLDESGKPLRGALPRNQLFRAQVRLAETHNFLASAATPSVSDEGLAAAADAARETADAAAKALVKRSEGGMQHDKEHPESDPAPAAMVKTYAQRLAMASSSDEQGKDGQRYTVNTLESVWFTDVLEYQRKEMLDSVTENFDPVRYYRYFWDVDRSAEVKFENDAPLKLDKELLVEIREKQHDNSTVEKTVTVNPAEPGLGGHSAFFYVTTQSDNSAALIRDIEVMPTRIEASVGDAPVELQVSYKPAYATDKRLKWSSSNEKVAAVTAGGVVSFLAPGAAVITVRAVGGASASVEVIVTDGSSLVQGVFDLGHSGAFLTMTPDGAFLPERTMNRGELVIMLARLYAENPDWKGIGSGDFPDITGTEGYAAAARLLGEKGIITGISGGFFAAGNTATRAEMAVILARMLGLEIEDTRGRPHAFADAGEKDTWAYAYIDALAKYGIIKGTGDGRFNPGGILTRAEAACMLSRILGGEVDPAGADIVKPADVPPGHWGYQEILRAVNGLRQSADREKK